MPFTTDWGRLGGTGLTVSSRSLLGIRRRGVEGAVSHLQFEEVVLETGTWA